MIYQSIALVLCFLTSGVLSTSCTMQEFRQQPKLAIDGGLLDYKVGFRVPYQREDQIDDLQMLVQMRKNGPDGPIFNSFKLNLRPDGYLTTFKNIHKANKMKGALPSDQADLFSTISSKDSPAFNDLFSDLWAQGITKFWFSLTLNTNNAVTYNIAAEKLGEVRIDIINLRLYRTGLTLEMVKDPEVVIYFILRNEGYELLKSPRDKWIANENGLCWINTVFSAVMSDPKIRQDVVTYGQRITGGPRYVNLKQPASLLLFNVMSVILDKSLKLSPEAMRHYILIMWGFDAERTGAYVAPKFFERCVQRIQYLKEHYAMTVAFDDPTGGRTQKEAAMWTIDHPSIAFDKSEADVDMDGHLMMEEAGLAMGANPELVRIPNYGLALHVDICQQQWWYAKAEQQGVPTDGDKFPVNTHFGTFVNTDGETFVVYARLFSHPHYVAYIWQNGHWWKIDNEGVIRLDDKCTYSKTKVMDKCMEAKAPLHAQISPETNMAFYSIQRPAHTGADAAAGGE